VERYEMLIVGGGAAGLAAAAEAAARGAKRVLLCERENALGGVLPQCIHHGFGLGCFGEDLTGPEYCARWLDRLAQTGTEVRTGTAVLSLSPERTALLSAPGRLERVGFDACVLCAGAREKPLGALPVSGTRPAGVFTAGQAQKLVNLGHYDVGSAVVILGSGDVGQIMARRLTLLGKRVVALVEQADALGGLARNRRACIEAYRIPVLLRATVVRLHGAGRLRGVTVRRLDSGAETYLPCDTLIAAVGLVPERELLSAFPPDAPLPGWLRCAGNCEAIHDIVDAVSAHAADAVRALLPTGTLSVS